MADMAFEKMTQEEFIEWDEDGLHFTEVCTQVYAENGSRISGGWVEGHPVDTVYFRFERPGHPEQSTFILLRPDEMAALAWICNGVLFSKLIEAAQ